MNLAKPIRWLVNAILLFILGSILSSLGFNKIPMLLLQLLIKLPGWFGTSYSNYLYGDIGMGTLYGYGRINYYLILTIVMHIILYREILSNVKESNVLKSEKYSFLAHMFKITSTATKILFVYVLFLSFSFLNILTSTIYRMEIKQKIEARLEIIAPNVDDNVL